MAKSFLASALEASKIARPVHVHAHVIEVAERTLQALERAIDLSAGFLSSAVRVDTREELARVAHLLHRNSQLVLTSCVKLLEFANTLDYFASSPRELLFRKRACRTLAQRPSKIVIVIPPFTVDQPQRAVEQDAIETAAFHRRLRLGEAKTSLFLEIVRQHVELQPVRMVFQAWHD